MPGNNSWMNALRGVLAGVFVFGVAIAAQGAHTWTGNVDGNINNKNNYSATTYSGYYNTDNLTGNKVTTLYLPSDLTGSFKFAGDGTARYRALDFQKGRWQLHGKPGDTIYKWDNSGGYDSSEDKERICVGSAWKGGDTSGDASLRMHAIDVKLRRLFVGSSGTTKGTLILDDKDETGTAYHGPVTLETTDNIYLQRGSMAATNAIVKCGGDLSICNGGGTMTLVVSGGSFEVASGKWTRFESGGTGSVRIGNATFKTRYFKDYTGGGASMVLDGGTIQCNGTAQYGLIDATIDVKVDANGGTINTGGNSFNVPAAINAVENTAGAFTVTGGGTVTFPAMGSIAGAFTVGENTTVRWFDQDGVVSGYTFAALSLAPGATLYLDADATGCDALSAAATSITATAENPATFTLVVHDMPESGRTFPLLAMAAEDADKCNVAAETAAGAALVVEKGYADGRLTYAIIAKDYVWNDGANGGGWTDGAKWNVDGAASAWANNNNAVFANAGDVATLDADVAAVKLDFRANATVGLAAGAQAALFAPVVTVAQGASATVDAPISSPLAKEGAGTLTLGSSRTEQTTLSEGTLVMANGATVDPAKLRLGSEAAKPVTFDYGGGTLDSALAAFVKPGADVTLTNCVISNSGNIYLTKDTFPSVLTVASDASLVFGDHFSLNTMTEATLNIAGGKASATKNANNWIMQTSPEGRLNINVTDGGLLYFAGEVYMLTCRDTVDGSNEYRNPSLYLKVVDSTLRVANSKSLRFGYDGNNKNPISPTGVFAATNSTIDVEYAISIGNNVLGDNTAGSYTADFEHCAITTRSFRVYHDRPLNAARFNNTRLTLGAYLENSFYSSPEFETMGEGGTAIKPITIDADGLVIDTNGNNGDLQADPQGPGAITKVGSGILHVRRNLTSSSQLVCEGGETYVYDGLSISRPVTVKGGAKFTTKGAAQVSLASLSLDDGAELRIDQYAGGVTPMKLETGLTLPANGTAALTKNGNFAQGKYMILEKTGIAVSDVQDKLVPTTVGGLSYAWSVEGDILVLTVGSPSAYSWTGLAGDGKMSTPGNWYCNAAPGAGDAIDFTSLNMAATINADLNATFGAVTMGEGIVTFTGALSATSFSDTLKVTVGADSTVTLDGDLLFSGAGGKYVVYRVEAGGAFIVTGRLGHLTGSSGNLRAQSSVGEGIVVTGQIVNDASEDVYACVNKTSQKWAIGPGGLIGSRGWWCLSDAANSAYFYPYTNDFTVAVMTCIRSSFGRYELNTTGWGDGAPHTITLDAGYSDNGKLFIAGTGKVVVNHTRAAYGGKGAYSGAVTVQDTATLAINPGKELTSGAISVGTGATLAVAQSGTVALGGGLALADKACLEFHYTDKAQPVLALADKTVTFAEGETTNVMVRISAPMGKCPSFGTNVLTTGGKFADATVTLAAGAPKWAQAVEVDSDGNIALTVRPLGLTVYIR